MTARTVVTIPKWQLSVAWIPTAWPVLSILLVVAPASAALGAANVYTGQTVELTNWVAIGPFLPQQGQEKHSEGYRLGGRAIEPSGLPPDSDPGVLGNPSGARAVPLANKNLVDFYARFPGHRPSHGGQTCTFYAQALVHSDHDVEAQLLLGSDGIATAWVNGKAVCDSRPERDPERGAYNTCVGIKLRQGQNVLLIRAADVTSVRGDESCGVVAALAPTIEAAADHLMTSGTTVFSAALATPGSRFWFDRFPIPLPPGPSAHLFDSSGRELVTASPAAGPWIELPATLADGIYRVEASTFGHELSTDLVVGDPERMLIALQRRVASLPLDEASRINCDALLFRAGLLLEAKHRYPQSWQWNRKVLFAFADLYRALDAEAAHRSAWKDAPGLHLLGFKSEMDGQVRHYRIFIPSCYRRGHPIPLMAMLAPAMLGKHPFLTSPFVANHIEAEQMAQLGEQAGVAILWPGFPSTPSGNPDEFTHFTEVMAALNANYDIDPARISVCGICKAASFALMYAEHWPRAFAAVALLDPVDSTPGLPPSPALSDAFSLLRSWQLRNDPVLNARKVQQTNVAVAFDEGDPGHGTRLQADRYAAATESSGAPTTRLSPTLTLSHLGAWRDLLAWAKTKALGNTPGPDVWVSADDRALGPIMNALAEPFVLVQGTGGSAAEAKVLAKWSDDFVQRWTESHFVPCRRMPDTAITPEIEAAYNLVLVGNVPCNRLWANSVAEADLEMRPEEMRIHGKSYRGVNLAAHAVVRNKRHPNRKIILVGARHLEGANLGPANLSMDGWYDYAVWSSSGALVIADNYSDSPPTAR